MSKVLEVAQISRELPVKTTARIATVPNAATVKGARSASLPEDERLAIMRTLAGQLNAFNDLIIKYQTLAYNIAYRILQVKEAAADAVQESFLKAYRALASFNGGSFKSWLTRIVVNTCYDMYRVSRYLPTEALSDEPEYEEGTRITRSLIDVHESPQEFVERMELSARIELGLRALPYEQRLALVLSDIHGYSYDEICEVTGMAMGTVKSRISRARLKLRDFLLEQQELLPADLRA